ncbi:MAG: choice-of-anchor J domain-containing protein [Bacteroidota bacterium]
MHFSLYKNLLIGLLLLGSASTAFAQLSEGFEGMTFPPTGWAAFDNGVCSFQSWQQVKATLNPRAYNGDGYAFAKFSNVSNEACEDWLVTPALSPTAMNNSISFYAMDDFAADYGSLYTIQVSTESQSDRSTFEIIATYSEEDMTADVYQEFTVDLSDYIGQNIYVAFVLENSRGDSFFLDDISGPDETPILTVPNCDATLTQPSSGAIEVSINTALAWSPATGDPTSYKLRIGTTLGGDEVLGFADELLSGTTYTPQSPFAYSTTYYVTILPTNGVGDANTGDCTDFSFTTEADPNIVLDCAGMATPVQNFMCYGESEIEAFTISSNNGSQVEIAFTSGTVEVGQDELYVYDGTDDTGILLNEGDIFGVNGDFAGLSYISSTGSLFIQLIPDATNDCRDGQQSLMEFTASCASCTPATASVENTICDDVNDQFSIELDVTGLGSGTINISNDQNMNVQTVSALGTVTIGPFNFGEVILTLENPNDPTCDVELLPVLIDVCPPTNDECANAIAITASLNETCNNQISSLFIAASGVDDENTTLCSGGVPDMWYSFTPTATDQYVFDLVDSTGNLDIAIYSGDCINGLTALDEDCFGSGVPIVDLMQNEIYLIQVYGTADSLPFDLCAYVLPPAPANDLCANATELSCPVGESFSGVDVTYATNTDVITCGSEDALGRGVWYKMMGTDDYIDLSIAPQDWDVAIQVWTGADCNNLVCDTTVNIGSIGTTESLSEYQIEIGVTYYIYIGAIDDLENPGLFDLSITCSEYIAADVICLDDPENDPCNDIRIEDGAIDGTVSACQNISTESEVLVVSGSNLVLTSGVSITLKPGFHAQAGSDVHAFIVNCTPNGQDENDEVEQRTESVEEEGQALQLQIAPNPAQDWIQMTAFLPQQSPAYIWLSDLNGKRVQEVPTNALTAGWNQLSIHRTQLPDGIYFLTIQTAQERLTQRFVLTR